LEILNFSAEFSVKNLVCFPSFFSWKLGGKPKTFPPLFWFEVKNSKESFEKGQNSTILFTKKCLKNK
jgi:hypothetical protein